MRVHAFLVLCLFWGAVSCVHRPDSFTHTVDTAEKPWTHDGFKNDPAEFQFAILTDRTGGMREGVFASAVDKVNSIQPEFVISVGDYIQGYTRDTTQVQSEWEEIEEITSRFEMPFFFLPGNHDITNPEMSTVYEERFGRRYYAFTYKDVLFVCLDTQDKPIPAKTDVLRDSGLLPAQVEWATNVLREHGDARWTFVLMHQPLWLYEGRSTGWSEIEAVLGDRDFTVLAGHLHRYTKYVRRQRDYYVLATTGGGSQLRGPAYGEFDHAVWVTMSHDGPKLANLLLDGIRDQDIYTECTTAFRNSLRVNYTVHAESDRVVGSLRVHNTFQHALILSAPWAAAHGPGWRLSSTLEGAHLHPGEEKTYAIELDVEPGADLADFPELELACVAGSELNGTYVLTSPLQTYLSARRPRQGLPRLGTAPVIDGILDEDEWTGAAVIPAFQRLESSAPSEDAVRVWCGYDSEFFYLSGRFIQDPSRLRLDYTQPDEPLWEDDSLEVFMDVNLDGKTFAKALVTAGNHTRLESLTGMESATGRTEDAWTVELKIPWDALRQPRLTSGDRFGINLRRHRSLDVGRRVSEWSATLIDYPIAADLFGIMELE